MPQKKNPDAAELLRAKAPRIAAHLTALHGVMHALPLTYNKDLQEDKEHLFDAADTLALCLAAAEGMVDSLSFDRERLATAAADEFLAATDLASWCAAACPSARRTGWWLHSCEPRLPRGASSPS
jgi:argininosuccinate lyase